MIAFNPAQTQLAALPHRHEPKAPAIEAPIDMTIPMMVRDPCLCVYLVIDDINVSVKSRMIRCRYAPLRAVSAFDVPIIESKQIFTVMMMGVRV